MPKGKPGIRAWLTRKKLEQERGVQARTRLLPADLADQIVAAADAEIALLIARVDAIDAEIAGLRRTLSAVRADAREALAPVSVTPSSTRRNWRAEIRHKSGRLGLVSTPASIEAAGRARAISRRIRLLGRERVGRQTEIREAQKVADDAERGVVSALLTITSRWRSQVNLAGLPDRVKLGRSHSFWSDAAGYPLPETALDFRGKPLPYPKKP